MPRLALLPPLALAALLLLGCGSRPFIDARNSGGLEDGSGARISWSPRRPAIGDLVRLEARFPGEAADALAFPPGYPDAAAGAPLSNQRLPEGSRTRWSFRVEAPGGYRLGGRLLFEAESLAKDGTELKTLDANALWAGTASRNAKPAAAPAAGGNPAP